MSAVKKKKVYSFSTTANHELTDPLSKAVTRSPSQPIRGVEAGYTPDKLPVRKLSYKSKMLESTHAFYFLSFLSLVPNYLTYIMSCMFACLCFNLTIVSQWAEENVCRILRTFEFPFGRFQTKIGLNVLQLDSANDTSSPISLPGSLTKT